MCLRVLVSSCKPRGKHAVRHAKRGMNPWEALRPQVARLLCAQPPPLPASCPHGRCSLGDKQQPSRGGQLRPSGPASGRRGPRTRGRQLAVVCGLLAGRQWAEAEGPEAGAAVQRQGQHYLVWRGWRAGRGPGAMARGWGWGLGAGGRGWGLRPGAGAGAGSRDRGCSHTAPPPAVSRGGWLSPPPLSLTSLPAAPCLPAAEVVDLENSLADFFRASES